MSPAPTEDHKLLIGLAVLNGLLLGLSFPPVPTGILAFAAFVPFFAVLSAVDAYRDVAKYSYPAFFVFNLLTLYWTSGFVHFNDWYMVVAGSLLVIVHPVFFVVPVLAWTFVRRQFGFRRALFVFPFVWVAFEYLHSSTQAAFPWLMLANTQTYDVPAIQFASITGAYGITFWILCVNVLLFMLYATLATNRWAVVSARSIGLALLIVGLYVGPRMFGTAIVRSESGTGSHDALTIGVVQPDIDPFEKWLEEPDRQVDTLLRLTHRISTLARLDLILWPETAIPYYVLHPQSWRSFEWIRRTIDSIGTPLLTGIPDIRYFSADEPAPRTSKVGRNGERYITHNSSMLVLPGSPRLQKYAKIILVPFAERVPFSEQLHFLNAMQRNFGLGGWEIGPDTTVFELPTHSGDSVKFSNLICYESIYPAFVAGFVRRGAQFLTVVTNDSWWGNTSGAYQHKQLAVLRAVENRRWIVQCANGGISCFIDPLGRIVEETGLFTQRLLVGGIVPRTDQTFYTRHGDWLAELCIFVTGFALAAAAGSAFYTKRRLQERNDVHRSSE